MFAFSFIFFLILFINLSFTFTKESTSKAKTTSTQTIYKVPTSTNIYWIKEENKDKIKPGDIFQYEPGVHTNDQYLDYVEGTKANPIIIRGGKDVIIEGKIFFEHLTYINFEGPFELRNSPDAALVIFTSEHLVITGFTIHHSYLNGMKITGKDILIKNNLLYECNQVNYQGQSSYWGQSIGTDHIDGKMSSFITIEDNIVKNSWGEGIDLLYCNYCLARRNKVENAYPVLYYIDNSQNSIVEKNFGYQVDYAFNRRETLGIQIGTEAHGNYDIINCTFRDNLILNTAFGFSFYPQRGHYETVKVVHNTFFNTSKHGFRILPSFEPEKVKDNEVSNNVFSGVFSVVGDAHELTTWKVFSNAWIGGAGWDPIMKDSPGYEGSSIEIRDVFARGLLFNFEGTCFKEECYRPRKNDTIIYKKGRKSSFGSNTDYYGMKRDGKNPTIGFSEEKEGTSTTDIGSFIKNKKIFMLLGFMYLI